MAAKHSEDCIALSDLAGGTFPCKEAGTGPMGTYHVHAGLQSTWVILGDLVSGGPHFKEAACQLEGTKTAVGS